MASRDRTKNRSEIKFKSAGQLKSVVDKAKRDFQFQKLIGIKTPLELGSDRDGLFKMHKNLKDQIKDRVKLNDLNIIQGILDECSKYNYTDISTEDNIKLQKKTIKILTKINSYV